MPMCDRPPVARCGCRHGGRTATRARRIRESAGRDQQSREALSARILALIDQFVDGTELDFLFDSERHLLPSLQRHRGTPRFHLLRRVGVRARLASFIAIAMRRVSQEHWFKLGRLMTPVGRYRALVSWSASMFEYLMPLS